MPNKAATPPSWDTELILLACAGDRTAFDQLVPHYRPVLLGLTFLRTRDLCEAEDLVQEILLRVWQKLPGLHIPALFLPWMKTIAANTCSTWYRRRPAQTTSLDTEPTRQLLADGATKPLEIVLSGEKQRELHRALLLLPQANRLALLMHVWGDYSYAEIAALTEVPVTTVEGRIYRAKRQMQRLLYDEGTAFLTSSPSHPIPETTKEHTHDKPEDH
jgi:RNA polymerase sigma-70 factor (ECF subfamily)